jgi:hypothetical protein
LSTAISALVGAVLVNAWAQQPLTDTGKVLLDRDIGHPVVDEIRDVVAATSAR